jgi:hypothetical protein
MKLNSKNIYSVSRLLLLMKSVIDDIKYQLDYEL